MYVPQGHPAVFFSILAFHVMATVLGLLSGLGIPSFDLCLHFPELLSEALLFGRYALLWLWFAFAIDLLLPYCHVAVILFHKDDSLVIRPFERLHIGITVL